eukprot:4508425-Amphidinium_carterae.1
MVRCPDEQRRKQIKPTMPCQSLTANGGIVGDLCTMSGTQCTLMKVLNKQVADHWNYTPIWGKPVTMYGTLFVTLLD